MSSDGVTSKTYAFSPSHYYPSPFAWTPVVDPSRPLCSYLCPHSVPHPAARGLHVNLNLSFLSSPPSHGFHLPQNQSQSQSPLDSPQGSAQPDHPCPSELISELISSPIRLLPQWFPCSSSPPQGLCTCCSACWILPKVGSFLSIRSQLLLFNVFILFLERG